jgi:hypothetical protein
LAAPGAEQTYTIVPRGTGWRIGIDRDADGYPDRDEIDFGSDPANSVSLATNTAPRLSPVNTVFALKGHQLTLNLTAVDNDIPAQALTFSLTNSPPDAALNPTNGAFNWIPSGAPGTVTNSITVVVTDNGNPPRNDSKTFLIVANDLSAGAPLFSANGISLNWNAIAGLTYRVQFKNNLTDADWSDLPGDIIASNNVALKLDSAAITNTTRFYRIIALP